MSTRPVSNAMSGVSIQTHSAPLGFAYALERVLAVFAIAVLALPGGLLALTIFVLSGRSPLVRHSRLGWRGAPLPMLKLRTMWPAHRRERRWALVEDVADRVPLKKAVPDDRVTSSIARFCRRYSIDELPQLWHVARGEMSLAGPRPITALEMKEYYGPAAAKEVLSVRPGMAGLWQTMGRNSLTYPQRRRLDLFFVRRASSALYVRVLLQTLPAVLRGAGAS